jgi:hypothetical protein
MQPKHLNSLLRAIPHVAAALVLLASNTQSTAADSGLSWESQFRFSAIGDAAFTDGPNDLGDVSALDYRLRAVTSLPAGSNFLLRAGVDFEQIHFDVPGAARVPDVLQMASLVLGTDVQIGEAWILRVDIQPGFYGGGTSLRSGDFNVPITLGASFFVSADLQFVAGVSIDVNRKYPVLPGVGLRWKVSPAWVVNAILPNPRLEYTVNEAVLLYAGADIQVGTYRVDRDFGSAHHDTKLNEAVVDYAQIRAGLGASWKVTPAATVELEAGFVPVYDLDYHRAEFRVRSDDLPPYGGINVKLKF